MRTMKKLTLYLVLISICSCGVPKSEHFALKIEKEKLQGDYDYLQKKYDKLKQEKADTPKAPTQPESTAEESPSIEVVEASDNMTSKGGESVTNTPTSSSDATKEVPLGSTIHKGIKIDLLSCEQIEDRITCNLLFTSENDAKLFWYRINVHSKITDMKGNEYLGAAGKMGTKRFTSSGSGEFNKGVPVKGSITYKGFSEKLNKARFIKVATGHNTYFKFENVPVTQIEL